MQVTFDHLTDAEFEEFTHDLLLELGFVNVDWRRGSGRGGATPDQGRDIVADERRKDPDGNEHLDKWFVQCKCHRRGVSPQELAPAVAWAEAERPAVLLIAVSNFLSNPAKTYLDDYKQSNRPLFRIKVWERKALERLASSYPKLTRRYKLDPGDPVAGAHPAHVRYVLRPSLNTLDYFFGLLDEMEPGMRDDVLGWSMFYVINPRFREPVDQDETFGQLQLDAVDYPAFKRRCRELVENRRLHDILLVQAIMGNALAWIFSLSNEADTRRHVRFMEHAAKHFGEKLAACTDAEERKRLERLIQHANERVETAEERRTRAQQAYRYVCESLLPKLELEAPLIPEDRRA
ncbi:MAG: restriction endonuclease [Actinobacteria bacterium]|nr:MAG: restriction endonuclease [Actinomycetota bacterium]